MKLITLSEEIALEDKMLSYWIINREDRPLDITTVVQGFISLRRPVGERVHSGMKDHIHAELIVQ